ncbi:MAG: hypothetical protein NVS1B10_09060 [Candidatus Saccharimonadales bacterium]
MELAFGRGPDRLGSANDPVVALSVELDDAGGNEIPATRRTWTAKLDPHEVAAFERIRRCNAKTSTARSHPLRRVTPAEQGD